MSNAVFPNLPGLAWSVAKAPQWCTKIQSAVSGRELRAAFRSSPLYKFSLSYEVLREASAYQELQTLMAFFNARQGSFDSFLYTDPTDSTVTAQGFGSGNGATVAFQLSRAYGGNVEPVTNINGTPSIYVAGVLKTSGVDYTIGSGLVTFAVAPANAAALTWTGAFYYRCRFMADEQSYENFMYQLWSLKQLDMLGSLTTKI